MQHNILTRLKQETADAHQAAENKLYAEQILSGGLQVDQYRHLLRTHYRFHSALEAQLAVRPQFEGMDLPARRKTPLLEADFDYLGMPLPEADPDFFADWSNAQLLGASYVAEGSTLGGAVIARHLKRSEGMQTVEAFHFFGAYGEAVGVRWKEFCAFLLAESAGQEEEILEGAQAGFRAFMQLAEEEQVEA